MSADSEIEYSNVGYFDRQTVGEDEVEDPNEWLSVDIGDILEEEAAAKQQNQEQDKEQTSKADSLAETKETGQRPFIYDASPPGSLHSENPSNFPPPSTCPPSLPSTTPQTAPCTEQTKPFVEADEEDLKISFMNFKAGSIALFVPVDASRKVWMAFHSNKPNRFLAQQSLDVFLNRRSKNNDKTRILARIVYIEQHVAGQLNPKPSGSANTPDPVSPAVGVGSGGGGIGGAGGGGGGSIVKYEKDRNTYNLQPGTVYYECFAEPITITVNSKQAEKLK